MMKIRMNYNLQCEVETSKNDCACNPPHCNITRGGTQVARVWLTPVSLERGHSLERHEIEEIITVVYANRVDLENEYRGKDTLCTIH